MSWLKIPQKAKTQGERCEEMRTHPALRQYNSFGNLPTLYFSQAFL